MLVMIAAVVAVRVLAESSTAAPPASTTKPTMLAARVQALIRSNSQDAQIVTFADRRLAPVRIVRGNGGAMSMPGAHANLRGDATTAAAAAFPAMRRPAAGTSETVSFADPRERPVTVLRGSTTIPPESDPSAAASAGFELFAPANGAALDRVAFAVDGAESSHGADPAMWRPEFDGPQGPMQVSAAAATDAGGGDRFDLIQNRLLGRASGAALPPLRQLAGRGGRLQLGAGQSRRMDRRRAPVGRAAARSRALPRPGAARRRCGGPS